MKKTEKTVSLVLGSGGARGLAHIGVIRWLEENNYKITSISGCSMGALIGGIYALGKLGNYEKWVLAVTKRDIFSLLDFSLQIDGLSKGDKIIDTLKNMVGDTAIEDLPIPYTAVATNLENGKEVWMTKGSLFNAIRASISIPLLFTPYKYNDTYLIDGGIANPVPIAPTSSNLSDLTIAVNASGDVNRNHKMDEEIPEKEKPSSTLEEKISAYIEGIKKRASSYVSIDLGMFDIANQAIDAMQSTIARQKLAAYPPDVTIEIPRNVCTVMEFDRAHELIELGYCLTRKSMEQLDHQNPC